MALYTLRQISNAANTAAVTSSTPWIPLNHMQTPFNVGFGVRVGGTLTYSVQHTFSDIQAGVSAIAYTHADVSLKTTNLDGNYAFAVRAIRLQVATQSGSRSARDTAGRPMGISPGLSC